MLILYVAGAVAQTRLFFGLLTAAGYPLGMFMARVYEGAVNPLHRVLGPIERVFYRLAGVDPKHEMDWKQYAARDSRVQPARDARRLSARARPGRPGST